MTTVGDLVRWLDDFAPSKLAESWDNVGLLWGDPDAEAARVMTCLTVTARVADEAISENVDLIISHHPVLFLATKKIIAADPVQGFLWRLARAGVSIASPHTAFDNTTGGINDGLAKRLGLSEISSLRPISTSGAFKVVVFAPESERDALIAAAFNAGAGRIGAYEQCSFTLDGIGTFFGTEKSKRSVGRAGTRESVSESRLEVVCPTDRLTAVLAAIRAAHSYEEPAIDVYPLQPDPSKSSSGSGRIGTLPSATDLRSFASDVARKLSSPSVHFVGDPEKAVNRVAICCGAGDDFLTDAKRAGADVLLTGEARFHRMLEAEAFVIGLVIAGHYATERPGLENLANEIASVFAGLAVWASRLESDPQRPISAGGS